MYGIVGRGAAPKDVIEASLNDIGTDQMFVIPWYGKITDAHVFVYDWLIDNNVQYQVVALDGGRQVPKVLVENSQSVIFTEEVDPEIVNLLKKANGQTLVMWDVEDEETSVQVASLSIDSGLPTLELTNGLVPIVFSGDDIDVTPVDTDNLIVEDAEPMKFDRATLEVMPAAAVKRTAKTNGFDAKTKDEAIALLCGDDGQPTVAYITIAFDNGNKIALDLTAASLAKVMSYITGS